MRRIKKHATWLDRPHFGSLLYAYGVLFVRFVDLHSVEAEPVDDLGRPNAITDQLTRIAARLGQLAAQLGLSPASEKALRHDAAIEASHSPWLWLANHAGHQKCGNPKCACKDDEEDVVTPSPAPADSTPPAAANGTPRMPGFTAPV